MSCHECSVVFSIFFYSHVLRESSVPQILKLAPPGCLHSRRKLKNLGHDLVHIFVQLLCYGECFLRIWMGPDHSVA